MKSLARRLQLTKIGLYSKEETSRLKQEFWTKFGQYLAPVLSSEGLKINWVNYKTGEKYVFFKMYADNRSATIAIEVTHPDPGIQELYFEQFKEFKNIFRDKLGETWDWQLFGKDEYGKNICSILHSIDNVSIFNKNDWPDLISFFKQRIVALDEFWNDVKYSFEALR